MHYVRLAMAAQVAAAAALSPHTMPELEEPVPSDWQEEDHHLGPRKDWDHD